MITKAQIEDVITRTMSMSNEIAAQRGNEDSMTEVFGIVPGDLIAVASHYCDAHLPHTREAICSEDDGEAIVELTSLAMLFFTAGVACGREDERGKPDLPPT